MISDGVFWRSMSIMNVWTDRRMAALWQDVLYPLHVLKPKCVSPQKLRTGVTGQVLRMKFIGPSLQAKDFLFAPTISVTTARAAALARRSGISIGLPGRRNLRELSRMNILEGTAREVLFQRE